MFVLCVNVGLDFDFDCDCDFGCDFDLIVRLMSVMMSVLMFFESSAFNRLPFAVLRIVVVQ